MRNSSLGRKNITFGWLWILCALLFGVYLEIKLADPQWGIGYTRMLRKLYKDAHGHALCLAFLNILYGLTIEGAHLSEGIKNQGAWLAILGAVLFPLAMIFTVYHPPVFYMTYIAASFLFLAIWIMIVGYIRRPGQP
ncbi:hypothetical protein ACFL27_05320 [candidate division CSSED10-310 bacterium]|uniref:DUF423 domain-containing protein n=1 Tax=candidate division CSSED10-310 bacterium TaxID=2855610 RepID=A0ABV6YTU1_UNCC1